jgi:serine/threonine-protein kinase
MLDQLSQYHVIGKLGVGAGSTIYEVRDPKTARRYALKHVVRTNPKDLRFIEQVETEFQISKDFTHPALRRTHGLAVHRTLMLKVHEALLLMDLVEGHPLELCPPPTLVDTVKTFMQVAQGLGALHAMGYVHCDLKPNNILRNERGQAKIIDFGQSCRIGTIKRRIQGTPDYIAPEQVNCRPVTIQTDVFNLGATMYWTVTGQHIPTLYTIKKDRNGFLLDGCIPSPRELNPAAPPAYSNLIMECIATSARKRPGDMRQVLGRLEMVKHVLRRAPAPQPKVLFQPPDPPAMRLGLAAG